MTHSCSFNSLFQVLIQHFRKLFHCEWLAKTICKSIIGRIRHSRIFRITAYHKNGNLRIQFPNFHDGFFSTHTTRDSEIKNDCGEWATRIGFFNKRGQGILVTARRSFSAAMSFEARLRSVMSRILHWITL